MVKNIGENEQKNSRNYTTFNQMLKIFKELEDKDDEEKMEEKSSSNIKVEPKIIYNRFNSTLKIEVRIGESQLYKIKSLPEFYNRFINKEKYKYGNKLEFVHTKSAFSPECQDLLEYILKYAEIIKYANEASNGYEYYTKRLGEDSILISNTGMDELFDVLKNRTILMENEYETDSIEFLPEKPQINFELKTRGEKEFKLSVKTKLDDYHVFEGKENSYLLINKKMYKCSKDYERTVIQLLNLFKKNFTTEIVIPKEQMPNFFAVIEPYIKESIKIKEEDYEQVKNFIPEELYAKMFLDYDNQNYIVADIKFCYGEIEINPLSLNGVNNGIPRNEVKENKLIDMLVKSGFMLDQDNSRLILADEDRIYNFLTNDMDTYMKNFEVLATDKFRESQIRKTEKVSLGVRIENNLLDLDFSGFNLDPNEVQEIMKRYKLKKKYYRLKDGSFINLENNENIEFIDNITQDINIDYSQIKDNKLQLPMYRAFYLDKILEKNQSVHLTKNKEYEEIVDGFNKNNMDTTRQIPNKIRAVLRNYQIVGYNWLEVLDEYRLGGILADDMGLGKTIQLLCVICSYIENSKKRKPTLVVCPSSLALNWQNEIEKFTSGVESLVIHGTLEERIKQINSINQYDVVITSYELLKRDIEEYKKCDYKFKYIIADEAQYIKNNNTKNAKAIKEIKSEIRYALTGTPIENSLSELWSIFDFIMPGYLFSYKKFKELYETPIVKDEDGLAMNKLKRLINPFVLRRIKSEVLTELPDKTITVLNSQMTEEQREIYMSYLMKAKKSVAEELKENGIERNQIKILALLTRLRQISCHPSLFIDNYSGESGKLNQCIEIVKDAIESDHKILLFSVYTSMLEIIEKNLKKEGIRYLKLTGQTKVGDRIDLVDEFNQNEDIKVFLISLKAGGTGLNLTGADMVIHYDPWWNLSAENQATDRTYRIGQKRNVQVYKLITKDSIEEKIYELQNKKEMLIDNMLSTNQTFISKLTKEDIMNLFE